MSMKEIAGRFLGMNPMGSGLSSAMAPPAVEVRPLEEMMGRLASLTWEQWCLYAFSREPLRGRLPREERLALGREAAACGREAARRMEAEQGMLSPRRYAEKLGLKVERPEKANDGGYVIFAQFAPPDTIHLFYDCIRRAERLLADHKGLPVRHKDQVIDILVAHELFHFIEESQKELYTQSKKIPLWSLGPVKHSSRVSCLSEIAGMAFAGELCGLEWSPYLLDVFLVYGYNPEAATHLYEGILGAAGEALSSPAENERGSEK